MNRAQRRAQAKARKAQERAATTAANASGAVPVFGLGHRIIAFERPEQLRHYRQAVNAVVTRDESGGTKITLAHLSDDTSMIVRKGNPRKYSYRAKVESNPMGVWTLKRLASTRSEDEFVYRIFRASILDNLKAA